MRYAFIDTETGGLNPLLHSLLSVAVVITDSNLNIIDEFSALTLPDNQVYKVTARALQVNNINIYGHYETAQTLATVSLALSTFLGQYTKDGLVPAGWNLQFDRGFIDEYLFIDWPRIFERRELDASSVLRFLQLCGDLPVELGSLSSCVKHFELGEQEHDALGDCKLTVDVLKRMMAVCTLI